MDNITEITAISFYKQMPVTAVRLKMKCVINKMANGMYHDGGVVNHTGFVSVA